MGRLLAIDYGRKRCGVASTDTLQLVANPLTTVRACDLETWLLEYVGREEVDAIVVGHPTTMRGEESESIRWIEPALKRLRRVLPPHINIIMWDERFTSVLAHRAMIDGGMSRMDRRDKSVVDKISAAIILNSYLESRQHINKH